MIPIEQDQFAAFAAIAEEEAGLFLPVGKQAFVASRLQRRLRKTAINDFSRYLKLIQTSDADGRAERLEFVAALTTNVTSVYREPHHFALLAEHIRRNRPRSNTKKYRIWSAGCSSGEEPLSIAATCRAVLGSVWSRQIEVLATDVDENVLRKARTRIDGDPLAADLSVLPQGVGEKLVRQDAKLDQLVGNLQAGICYRQHNLLKPLEDGGLFDAIFCRNVTIYFSQAAQESVHTSLRARLAQDGLFVIGHSERLLGKVPKMVPTGRTAFRRADDTDGLDTTAKVQSSCR